VFGGALHLPLRSKKPMTRLRVGKNEVTNALGTRQLLADPFLIIAVALATTGPPVWSLKAILLIRLILFKW
jgi:hypothetical protein